MIEEIDEHRGPSWSSAILRWGQAVSSGGGHGVRNPKSTQGAWASGERKGRAGPSGPADAHPAGGRSLPTLRQLTYLVALADHLHFGEAARACFASQSTLSVGLRELEEQLGVVLVERTRRRVLLTAAGEQVAARARRLLQEAGELVDAARAAAEPLTGALRLGVIPSVGPFLLPRALPRLYRAHPKLRLYLREDLSARLLEQLGAGKLDALLLALPWATEGLEVLELGEDRFRFVSRPDHPFAGAGPVRVEDLPSEDLLLLEEGHCMRDHALAACRRTGVEAPAFQATSLATLVQMVAGRMGVTLLPELALAGDVAKGSGLVARDLQGAGSARRIGLVWRKGSPRAEEFRQLGAELQQALASMLGDRGETGA